MLSNLGKKLSGKFCPSIKLCSHENINHDYGPNSGKKGLHVTKIRQKYTFFSDFSPFSLLQKNV